MPQRALITGATGLLGRQVVKAFESAGWEVTGAGFSRASPPKIIKFDIQDADEVERVLENVKPDVVIHCAANRSPDSCTSDPEAARRLNVTSTGSLAKSTCSRSILLVYISTDYVFPGLPGQAPYKSTDSPRPSNIYGQTKLDGEEAVLNYAEGTGLGVVLRVPVLYGHVEPEGNHKESAVNVLMDAVWKSQDKIQATGDEGKVKMDDWALRYPTNTEDVARVCLDISKLYLSVLASGDAKAKSKLPFIVQFSSEDRMTKYEISQIFAEIMGLSIDGMLADKDGGGGGGTMRPYECHLDTTGLKELGIDVGTVNFVAWWRREVKAFRH